MGYLTYMPGPSFLWGRKVYHFRECVKQLSAPSRCRSVSDLLPTCLAPAADQLPISRLVDSSGVPLKFDRGIYETLAVF